MLEQEFRKADRWFTLKKNLKIEEFASFALASKQSDILLIIKDSFKELFTPAGGYTWKLPEFSFFDINNNPIKYKINNWTIEEIEVIYKSSTTTVYYLRISDPGKRINTERISFLKNRKWSNINDNDIDIVIHAIKKIHIISHLNNWEEYYLKQENEKLINRIKDLEDEIKKFKEDNDT